MSTDAKVTKDLVQTCKDGEAGFAKAAAKLVESGRDDLAKSEYARALDEDIAAGLRAVITRQQTAVNAAHDTVKRLRDTQS